MILYSQVYYIMLKLCTHGISDLFGLTIDSAALGPRPACTAHRMRVPCMLARACARDSDACARDRCRAYACGTRDLIIKD